MAIMMCMFVGCAAEQEEITQDVEVVALGDTGVTLVLPIDQGFLSQESQHNDFFGGGANGQWCVIVNKDEKEDISIAEYVQATADANASERIGQDDYGNYYFIHLNKADECQFYTAVRESEDGFYRIAFYCSVEKWPYYMEEFAQWSATIQIH